MATTTATVSARLARGERQILGSIQLPTFRRKTGAFSGLPHSPEKENGYRLRETDLRLKRPKLATASSSLKQSNSNSAAPSRSPSPSLAPPPVTYKELRQRGFRGTKYDAELLIQAQGFNGGKSETNSSEAAFLDLAGGAEAPLLKSGKSAPSDGTLPGLRLAGGGTEEQGAKKEEQGSITVGSCVSRDYTMTVRSLRNTAGRRAALCEEQRRVEAGKKVLKDLQASGGAGSRRCERGRVPSDSSSGIR